MFKSCPCTKSLPGGGVGKYLVPQKCSNHALGPDRINGQGSLHQIALQKCLKHILGRSRPVSAHRSRPRPAAITQPPHEVRSEAPLLISSAHFMAQPTCCASWRCWLDTVFWILGRAHRNETRCDLGSSLWRPADFVGNAFFRRGGGFNQ